MGAAEHLRSLGATGEVRAHQTGKEDLDNHVSHLLVLQRLQSVSVITLRQRGAGRGARGRRSARRRCGGSFAHQASGQVIEPFPIHHVGRGGVASASL